MPKLISTSLMGFNLPLGAEIALAIVRGFGFGGFGKIGLWENWVLGLGDRCHPCVIVMNVCMASVAKWLRHWFVVPASGGSSPLVRP
jgi:hypothetical protein